ncbi:MAG: rhodanese-like domain-containing protein [Isosphaeraceae bacterium]
MNDKTEQVTLISPRELNRRIGFGEALLILDVREDFEREASRLETTGSVLELHIPMNEIPARFDEIVKKAEERPIAVYCHHGVRSMVVARYLTARGAKSVLNLTGGIDAWSIHVDSSVPRY